MTDKTSIGIFVFEFLPGTQTFIFNELDNLDNYAPCIMTDILLRDNNFKCDKFSIYKHKRGSLFNRGILYLARPRFYRSDFWAGVFGSKGPYLRYIERKNMDLIHSHFALDGLFAAELTADAGIPLVVSLHGGYDIANINNESFPRDRFFESVDCFVVPSLYIKSRLEASGCCEDKIRVVPYGINIDAVSGSEEQAGKDIFKIVLVGRLTEKKGLLDALRAVKKVKERSNRKISFTIVTGGSSNRLDVIKGILSRLGVKFCCTSHMGYEKKVREYISCNGLENEVQIIGYMSNDEVRSLMRTSHVFLLPSRTASDGDTEGLPVSILEAQAEGLPVITTFHAGNPEAVEDGRTGYVVEEGDVEAMAARIEYLMQNPDQIDTLGGSARRNASDRFSLKKHTDEVERIYAELIG